MKTVKLSLVIFAALVIAFGISGVANAFHSGGVAECVGCHSMHSAVSGALLKGSDISSTCLNCHGVTGASSYHIATPDADMPAGTPPGNRTPGGDFGWLKKTYTWSPRTGTTETDHGERHGHNIIAADFGYDVDTTNSTAPGGTMAAADLSCNSCHDQHSKLRRLSDGSIATTGAPIIGSGSYDTSSVPAAGQAVGVYRLLRGLGSEAGSGGVLFTNAVPAAVVPSTYNRSEAVTDTRVAYGAGWSKFCATCHPDMHVDSGNLVHPVDQNLGSTIAGNYNSYVGSGNLTGSSTTSYDSVIPFQKDNSTDYAALKLEAVNNGSVTTGPAGTDRVMCLSCHRSHASGWEYMTRWDNEIELIAVDGQWPGTDATGTIATQAKWAKGRTIAERAKAYNDKPATRYATYQRVLCNKCHAKD